MSDRFHIIPFAFVLALAVSRVATAEIIDCGAGDVQCLIAAINQANADPHKTTIHLAGGTYALTDVDNNTNGPNGLPSIVSSVTIDGANSGTTLTRISTSPAFRILHVGASGRLTLDHVTVSGGIHGTGFGHDGDGLRNEGGVVTIVQSSFIDNGADGGVVYNNGGVVTISDSTLTDNFSIGIVSVGGVLQLRRTVFDRNDGIGTGGVWMQGGDLLIDQSRFAGNHGHHGAGGVQLTGATALISHTTFAGNAADGNGGIQSENASDLVVTDSAFVENLATGATGIANFNGTTKVINSTFARNAGAAGIINFGIMTLLNNTFAQNTLLSGASLMLFSAIDSASGATTLLENTIVVHNAEDAFVQDCAGVVTSLGNNLFGDTSCNMTIQSSDLLGNAGLGDFLDDGTPGNAHFELLPESQAIDAANRRACPLRDQIGQLRRPRCDIGAIEFRRTDVIPATQ